MVAWIISISVARITTSTVLVCWIAAVVHIITGSLTRHSILVAVVICEYIPVAIVRLSYHRREARDRLKHGGDLLIGVAPEGDERVVLIIRPVFLSRNILAVDVFLTHGYDEIRE